MQRHLLENVFSKAIEEGATDNTNALATHVHNEMDKRSLKPPTVRTIATYRQKMEAGEALNISPDILKAFSEYLGYKNFKDFIANQQGNSVRTLRSRYLIILLLAIIGLFLFDKMRKKCMRWEDHRYVKVHCEEPNATPQDAGLLANFRMVEAKCTQDFFFHPDGSPKVWYFKRGDKDLVLFSSPGVHPLNGKDLNRINVAMIRKHICPDF